MKNLIKFDAYPKTEEELNIKTISGATVTLVSSLIIFILFVNELHLYLTPHLKQNLVVDFSQGGKVDIDLDLDFPRLKCSELHIDALDISGSQQLGIRHDLYLDNLDINGEVVELKGSKNKVELGSSDDKDNEDEAAKAKENKSKLPEGYCGECYGAPSANPSGCCNTCQDVKEAYDATNWNFANSIGKFEQCIREGITTIRQLRQQTNENPTVEDPRNVGCKVNGQLSVNKVKGNFHIAPGKSSQRGRSHLHHLSTSIDKSKLNLTHVINKVSFGQDFPGVINPLTNHYHLQSHLGPKMFQYFVKLVPTIYFQKDTKTSIKTNQYSVYEYSRDLHQTSSSGLPGIFFIYDFSPIMVEIVEEKKSFFHFITQLFGLLGGIYSISSLIDNLLFRSLNSFQKKIELGKIY
ncbi:endoplasmic reticulum-golgi intermediate compartment protein [Anaeramoeba flamelloides]|uniref:Endoplasmic reticulum-golgi intermediate compartment protein n=1 Tax=Anaeramoeba flamelloides TaxID=1746091 RepID=A0AAV7ZA57_9EUKA|nr:endoplasmic reticulum-golgi intermediate compartment protein [Anaeramoeba flamelloides]